MKSRLVTILSVIMSIGIVLSTMIIIVAIFLQSTIFSYQFYSKSAPPKEYIPLLKQAITKDLMAQSSYVAIPLETLSAGLNDEMILNKLNSHEQNVVDYLNYKSDFIKAQYPENLYRDPLQVFIDDFAKKNKIMPSQEQLKLLDAVAGDSAKITTTHINLINLDIVKDIPEFKKIHKALFTLGKMTIPFIIIIIGLLLGIFFIQRRRTSSFVLYTFTSTWIVSVMVMVPAILLEISGITTRLAIKTGYLKFVLDNALLYMNRYFIIVGATLFVISSIALIARILFAQDKNYEATNYK